MGFRRREKRKVVQRTRGGPELKGVPPKPTGGKGLKKNPSTGKLVRFPKNMKKKGK
jgi:hypothetical protein